MNDKSSQDNEELARKISLEKMKLRKNGLKDLKSLEDLKKELKGIV